MESDARAEPGERGVATDSAVWLMREDRLSRQFQRHDAAVIKMMSTVPAR